MAESPGARSESDLPIAQVYDQLALDGFDAPERLGAPGKFPFTRGVYPSMYTGRPWTMRQYAGFGNARESNEKYHQLVAAEESIAGKQLTGTIQNDVLKEYIARGTYIYPPKESLRLISDIFTYCHKEIPRWNTISISGYHMAEAGATPAQEIAFTLANAKEYVRTALAAGLDIDDFAPRLSFFFVARTTLLEEVAKFRAARRIWAHIMRDEFGAKSPKSQMLRFHTQTAGVQLTAQQPEVNMVRVALQGLGAVLGGTQSLHTNSFDEALALPSQKAARLALRTQQVIAYETDVCKTVDPFAGSYVMESMSRSTEASTSSVMDSVEDRGGAVAAIEQGFQKSEIERSAYRIALEIDRS